MSQNYPEAMLHLCSWMVSHRVQTATIAGVLSVSIGWRLLTVYKGAKRKHSTPPSKHSMSGKTAGSNEPNIASKKVIKEKSKLGGYDDGGAVNISNSSGYRCDVIGVVRSCFKQRFGIPRQPGLVPLAIAELELHPPWNHPDAVRGLDAWSHVWVTFVFHETKLPKTFKATVHPPRGTEKYGVFATRTTHRPNRLGLSLCRLTGVEKSNNKVILKLSGVDLLDETPVLDIKPYVPYTEAIPDAVASFAPEAPSTIIVKFTEKAENQLAELQSKHPQIRKLAVQVLSQDPRPTFRKRRTELADSEKEYCQYLCDVKLKWTHTLEDSQEWITVHECTRLPLADTPSMFQ